MYRSSSCPNQFPLAVFLSVQIPSQQSCRDKNSWSCSAF